MKRIIIIVTLLLLPVLLFAQLSAKQVIDKMEANQVHKTAKSSGKMIITNRFGTRTKTFETVSEGEDKMIIKFTNKEDHGQKILRINDEIYLYFPDAEGLLHLQGGALKDSVMGSDFSYEDMTGEKGIFNLYNVELMEKQPVRIDDYTCYHLKLTGKKPVAYPIQEIWVDSELFVLRQAEYFSLSGTRLKTLEIADIRRIKGKNIPTHFIMKDALKKNSSTEFVLDDMEIDVALKANQFSFERLSF